MSLKNEKTQESIVEDLTRRQETIPLINLRTRFGAHDHCGVMYSYEYNQGTFRVHIGNMFAGIEENCEKRDFNSIEELLDAWQVD